MFTTKRLYTGIILFALLAACSAPAPLPTPAPTAAPKILSSPTNGSTATRPASPTPVPATATTEPSPTSLPPTFTLEPSPTIATATPSGPALARLTAGQSISITLIDMLDANTGWGLGLAIGDPNDHILQTADGGQTWRDLTPPEPLDPNADSGLAAAPFFMDATHAWAAYGGRYPSPRSASAVVWRTADGGQTWQASAPLDFSTLPQEFYMPGELKFADAQTGWLLVHLGAGMNHDYVAIFVTRDGGQTWSRIVDPEQGDLPMVCSKTGLALVNAQTAWVTGDCNGVAPGLFFYTTSDGGKTWPEQTLPAPPDHPDLFTVDNVACGAYGPSLFAPQTGLLTMHCSFFDLDPTLKQSWLYTTADVGKTWVLHPLPTSLGSAYFFNPSVGWWLGSDSQDSVERQLYQTQDGGQTWTALRKLSWDGQFDFIDAQTGWAVARSGESVALVKTTDGGKKWSLLSPILAP